MNKFSEPTLSSVLHTAGQSLTIARQAVFDALVDQEPLTMAELVSRVPTIDRASVYRTVGLFEKLGIIQRLQIGWKYRLELSDEFHEHHHHATCMMCGSSFALPEDAALEERIHVIASTSRFKVTKHQLELQGYCKLCQPTG